MRTKIMNSAILISLLLLISEITPTLCSAGDSGSAPARIAGIRLMPYYTDKGDVRASTDLSDKRLVLKNIVVPADPSGDPLHREKIDSWDVVFGTTVTFVDVMIEASDFDKVSAKSRVKFVATGKGIGRTLASESVLLSAVLVRGAQTLHLPFIVYGTGCEPLEVRVQLLDGSAVSSELSRAVPFSCGE